MTGVRLRPLIHPKSPSPPSPKLLSIKLANFTLTNGDPYMCEEPIGTETTCPAASSPLPTFCLYDGYKKDAKIANLSVFAAAPSAVPATKLKLKLTVLTVP